MGRRNLKKPRRRSSPPKKSGVWLLCGVLILLAGLGTWLAVNLWIAPEYRADATLEIISGNKLPHVVLFLIDTQRADRLGCYGYAKPTSPNIDALAEESVLFEQCNAGAPWTLPSIATLFTSMYPCEHGVVHERQKIDPSTNLLTERLKRLGYVTQAFFANPYAGPLNGLVEGHDAYKPQPKGRGTDASDVAPWLDTLPGGKPFYLYVHNIEPHNPYGAPNKLIPLFGEAPPMEKPDRQRLMDLWVTQYKDQTQIDYDNHRPLGSTDTTARQQAALARLNDMRPTLDVYYDATVRFGDERVGSVVNLLKKRGLWDETLFILTADHGEELGERGGWQHDQSVYEELAHVPLLVKLPGGRFAGKRIKDVVSLVDVLPTILDILNKSDQASDCRGASLLPFIRGEKTRGPDEMVITTVRVNEQKYYQPYKQARGDVNVVIRQGDWKGIWNVEPQTLELYDLSRDPLEAGDLSKQHPDRAAAMRDFAREWFLKCRDRQLKTLPASKEALDDVQRDIMKSLGYL